MKRRFGWVLLILCLILPGCSGDRIPEQTVPTQLSTQATEESKELETAPVETVPFVTAPAEPAILPEPEDDQLVRVVDYIPLIREDLAYATENNFTGIKIYDFYNAYLRYGTVKKLAEVCDTLEEQGLGLLIWDGFRPLSAQEKLWEICPDPTFVSHPVTGNRAHCRGSAVDVTLVELETGEQLEMPTFFDDFSALADRDYSDCTPEAAQNAMLLENVMREYGFVPYRGEWWHFSDETEYPVDEDFEPPIG